MSEAKNTKIRFYHLERSTLEHALPSLVSKAYSIGHKICIQCKTEDDVSNIDTMIWTANAHDFIPHGTHKDDHKDQQPVYITNENENPNEAKVLILTHGARVDDLTHYDMVCEVFNGRNDTELQNARAKWKEYGSLENVDLSYHQQTDQGWVEKG